MRGGNDIIVYEPIKIPYIENLTYIPFTSYRYYQSHK